MQEWNLSLPMPQDHEDCVCQLNILWNQINQQTNFHDGILFHFEEISTLIHSIEKDKHRCKAQANTYNIMNQHNLKYSERIPQIVLSFQFYSVRKHCGLKPQAEIYLVMQMLFHIFAAKIGGEEGKGSKSQFVVVW